MDLTPLPCRLHYDRFAPVRGPQIQRRATAKGIARNPRAWMTGQNTEPAGDVRCPWIGGPRTTEDFPKIFLKARWELPVVGPAYARLSRKGVLQQYTCIILQQSKKIGEPGFSLSENPDSPVDVSASRLVCEFLWEVGRSR